VDTFLLCAWNYLSAVLRQHPEYDGRWIVPIPVPSVI
jgi:hypothetical protein